MKTFFKTIFIFTLLSLALPLLAADMRVVTSKKDIVVSEEFLVDVRIDSKESINAIEGKLSYPDSLISVKEIRDGASAVNFWIEKPESRSEGEVSFSGITPGGFAGDNNLIFSVLFQAKTIGVASVAFKDIKVLLNDGAGTTASSSISNTSISITKGSDVPKTEVMVDTELPEDFVPILGADPNLFDGKYFLVFATQDKISGIDFYSLREGRSGEWKRTESPYLLEDQTLRKKIFLHAVDRAGNVREVLFDPKQGAGKYKTVSIFAIIALLLLVVYLVRKKIWRKFPN